jgi:hypothetical protein
MIVYEIKKKNVLIDGMELKEGSRQEMNKEIGTRKEIGDLPQVMRRRAREDWSKLDGCVYKVESERV